MNRREGQRSRILSVRLCLFVLLFGLNASGAETAFAAETGGLFTKTGRKSDSESNFAQTASESDSVNNFVKVTSGSVSENIFTEEIFVSGSENLSVLHADFLTAEA
ncbi:MAG: hypothetical protein LUF30_12030 [Lachnospiraceae bacterium]|nr:hypothetical protein [Lachnospiraceae bacterium]